MTVSPTATLSRHQSPPEQRLPVGQPPQPGAGAGEGEQGCGLVDPGEDDQQQVVGEQRV